MKIAFDIQTLQTFEAKRGIGVATVELLKKIIEKDTIDDFFFVIQANKPCPDLSFLPPRKFKIFELKGVEEFQRLFGLVDVYMATSPLMPDILFPISKPRLAIFASYIHDLIPLAQKEDIFLSWEENWQIEYTRRIEYLKNYMDIGFCNSNYTKKDVARLSKIDPDKLKIASLGVRSDFFETRSEKIDYLFQKYIFTLGGNNKRKNTEGLIKAYSILPKEIKSQYSLVISGDYPDDYKNKLIESLEYEDREKVQIFNYLPITELKYLFENASLFVFPSKYEGFGIPLLESLAVGVPTICSDNSSLVEIIKNPDLRFDADDPQKIADKIEKYLKNPIDISKIDVSEFTYENGAISILKGLEETRNRFVKLEIKSRKTLAWFAPALFTKSGIANYSDEIIPYLRKYFDVTWFCDCQKDISEDKYQCFKNYTPTYDYTIYNIGNNEVNEFSYKTAEKYSGYLLIHDLIIDDFLRFIYKKTPEKFKQTLEHARNISKGSFEPISIISLVNKSLGVFVHNLWSANEINARLDNVFLKVINHSTKLDRFETSGENSGIFNVSTFGFVSPHKRVDVLVKAFDIARKKTDIPMKLSIVGQEMDSSVRQLVNELEIQNDVEFCGFVGKEVFESKMRETDLVVLLRFPTHGEMSGPLTKAIASAKPTIVTDIKQFKDFPDSFVWKVLLNKFEVEVLSEYIVNLAENSNIRKSMGQKAYDYAQSNFDPEFIAYSFYKSLND